MTQSVGKRLICSKDIRANDALSLTDDEWKTLTNLAKTWSSEVLPINRQYYEYTQVYELIVDRKPTFSKQHRSKNFRPVFRRHSLISKLKKGNESDKSGAEAAAASMSFPSDAPLVSARSSTTRTHSSTGNKKQFEKICFACNEIHPYDFNVYNEGELRVCEFKSDSGDLLMDAANAIGKTNTVNLLKENVEVKDLIK